MITRYRSTPIVFLAVALSCAAWMGAQAPAPAAEHESLTVTAREAISPNSGSAAKACARLRAAGPAGLEALLAVHKAVLTRGPSDPAWSRAKLAIDRVAGQYDAFASRLYWYEDLDEARAAALASGRPILSLRLLGRLDEDLSCANSRFFRTALYANADVARALREGFILHWSSERPVPHITIDYGNGRVIHRTITGNSIHYVLDAKGRPVDALPGLWGARAFLEQLERDVILERSLRGLDPERRAQALAAQHAAWSDELARAWPEGRWSNRAIGAGNDARSAGALSMHKGITQSALLGAVTPPPVRTFGLAPDLDYPSTLFRLVAEHRSEVRLDAASRALMRLKEGPGSDAPDAGEPGPEADLRFDRLVGNFENSIALDEVRNQYDLGGTLHEWFAAGAGDHSFEAFNRRVYDELFHSPQSDEWLGLVPADTYTAVDRGGATPR